jgi:hypothetical protein
LKIRVTRAIFRSSGIVPVRKAKLNTCENGSEIYVATVLITCELIPSYTGLLLEFKLFISFSNSYLVNGLIKKLFLQLLVRYLSKAVLELGSFFARPGPIFTK